MNKKYFQVLTDGGYDGGIDEKLSYNTLYEAKKSCKQFIQDGYRGAAIYDLKRKKWIEIFGGFRRYY